MTDPLDAASIARLSLHDPANFTIQHAQTQHRITLLQHWNIAPGSRLLELGCGQGDCTTVLASAVGEEGSVVGIDPADLNYGSPYTLGQAQSHISHSALGNRISWIQATPLDYLSSLPLPSTPPEAGQIPSFAATILAHSIYYFSSPSLILSTFRALKLHSASLHIAEWSLVATHPAAQPHVLAVLAHAALECRKPTSTSNVRTVLSPRRIRELAVQAGWVLESEDRVQCGEGLLDGQWEVGACLSERFEQDVRECVADERERDVVFALRDACEANLGVVEGGREGVRAMDVWVASFV